MTARSCSCGLPQHLAGVDQYTETFECSSGHRVTEPTGLAEALAERDRARDLAALFEAQLADISSEVDKTKGSAWRNTACVLRIRTILEVAS